MVVLERLYAASAIRPTVAAFNPVRVARTILGMVLGMERTPMPSAAMPIAPGNLQGEWRGMRGYHPHTCTKRPHSRPNNKSEEPSEYSISHKSDRKRQLCRPRAWEGVSESKKIIERRTIQPLKVINKFATEDDNVYSWTTECYVADVLRERA